MDANEIWQLIVKADEALKYATDEKRAVRMDQATTLLQQALSESEAIGNQQLAEQARTRLGDLGAAAGDERP